ncbi:hypothetical protein AVEN_59244-1 [Araneus ventricosus]|uniref:Uncharacterized protein n=1 Tax=Araneus ventricosus TaxID=182803 RepID=A0A4Y2CXS3_ARAVE|nr:hypothetical protein AVEN_59244-1 [Araneus ventricosus]
MEIKGLFPNVSFRASPVVLATSTETNRMHYSVLGHRSIATCEEEAIPLCLPPDSWVNSLVIRWREGIWKRLKPVLHGICKFKEMGAVFCADNTFKAFPLWGWLYGVSLDAEVFLSLSIAFRCLNGCRDIVARSVSCLMFLKLN